MNTFAHATGNCECTATLEQCASIGGDRCCNVCAETDGVSHTVEFVLDEDTAAYDVADEVNHLAELANRYGYTLSVNGAPVQYRPGCRVATSYQNGTVGVRVQAKTGNNGRDLFVKAGGTLRLTV